jgi:hypothetical protein
MKDKNCCTGCINAALIPFELSVSNGNLLIRHGDCTSLAPLSPQLEDWTGLVWSVVNDR